MVFLDHCRVWVAAIGADILEWMFLPENIPSTGDIRLGMARWTWRCGNLLLDRVSKLTMPWPVFLSDKDQRQDGIFQDYVGLLSTLMLSHAYR
jgi:hypothetical protein